MTLRQQFIAIAIVIITYVFLGVPNNIEFFITNILIIVLSIYGMNQGGGGFSLLKVFFIFTFVFFGFIPIYEFNNDIVYWGGGVISPYFQVLTNILILFGLLSFLFAYKLRVNGLLKYFQFTSSYGFKIGWMGFLFIYAIIYLVVLYESNFDLLHLWFRGLGNDFDIEEYTGLSQTQRLIYSNVIRPMPVFLTLLIYSAMRRAEAYRVWGEFLRYRIMLTISILSMLFLIPPTSIARFQAVALYFPFLVLFFPKFFGKDYFQFYVFFSLAFVFPILDKFRYFDPSNFNLNLDFSFIKAGHFDAYQNFCRVVSKGIITGGEQLLGVILFYVPRSFWPNKPIGSGAAMAEVEGLFFTNISMPFLGEGYINFGIFGVLLFSMVLGVLCKLMDSLYWNSRVNQSISFYGKFYLVFIGMLFFILRGDLLSSFAYAIGFFVSFFVLMLTFGFKLNINDNLIGR